MTTYSPEENRQECPDEDYHDRPKFLVEHPEGVENVVRQQTFNRREALIGRWLLAAHAGTPSANEEEQGL